MWFLPSSIWNYDRLLLPFCYYLSIRIVHLAFNPVSRTLSAIWLVYYMLRSPKHLSQLLFCHVSNKLFKIKWELDLLNRFDSLRNMEVTFNSFHSSNSICVYHVVLLRYSLSEKCQVKEVVQHIFTMTCLQTHHNRKWYIITTMVTSFGRKYKKIHSKSRTSSIIWISALFICCTK